MADFMRMRGVMFLILAAVVLALPVRASEGDLPQQYLTVYLNINQGEQAERKNDFKGALQLFEECYTQLQAIQKADPDWESSLVLHRQYDVKAKILELWGKVNAQVEAQPAPVVAAAGTTNTASTNLPPEVQAFQQSLPRLQAQAATLQEIPSPLQPLLGRKTQVEPSSHNLYPWKDNVATSTFWIGDNGEKGTAWAPQWVSDNGGPDTPDDRNGYATGEHASKMNPFYVALPFNDLAHPDLAPKWLPKGWARAAKNGKPVSACKDRWVMMKNERGDICYAQWEDAGPQRDDLPGYVFGNDAPVAGVPGIDMSPAVDYYLGLADNGPKLVSWRFVDDADVRPGAWLKLDEQAVIYRAMHHG
jgi:hypothetical protein